MTNIDELIETLDRYSAGDEFQRPVESAVEALETLRRQLEKKEAEIRKLEDSSSYHAQWSREFKSQVDYLKKQLAAENAEMERLKRTCNDERPCVNCFSDQGPCLGSGEAK